MKYHDEFEWDPAKAKANLKKHGVTFDMAAVVLSDEQAEIFHHDEYDDANSMKEDRNTTLASHPMRRSIVLKIAWTDRSRDDRQITRIISARRVTPRERILYEKAIAKRQ
jgi:uncharacterized protein